MLNLTVMAEIQKYSGLKIEVDPRNPNELDDLVPLLKKDEKYDSGFYEWMDFHNFCGYHRCHKAARFYTKLRIIYKYMKDRNIDSKYIPYNTGINVNCPQDSNEPCSQCGVVSTGEVDFREGSFGIKSKFQLGRIPRDWIINKECNDASIIIQCSFRCFKSRKELFAREQTEDEEEEITTDIKPPPTYDESIIIIQSLARRKYAMKTILLMKMIKNKNSTTIITEDTNMMLVNNEYTDDDEELTPSQEEEVIQNKIMLVELKEEQLLAKAKKSKKKGKRGQNLFDKLIKLDSTLKEEDYLDNDGKWKMEDLKSKQKEFKPNKKNKKNDLVIKVGKSKTSPYTMTIPNFVPGMTVLPEKLNKTKCKDSFRVELNGDQLTVYRTDHKDPNKGWGMQLRLQAVLPK